MRATTIFKSVAVIAALVAGQAKAAPTELVTNGSFEATTIANGSWSVYSSLPGWSNIGSGIELRNNVAGSAYDGSNFVELDSYSNSAIEQSIATAAGKHYTLNFAIQDRAGVDLSSQGVEVFWNGVSQGVFSNATNWTVKTLDLTASGATSTLRFAAAGTSDSLGTSLDKVSLVAAPVPEPETYGMLLAGLGLMGLIARRKRK